MVHLFYKHTATDKMQAVTGYPDAIRIINLLPCFLRKLRIYGLLPFLNRTLKNLPENRIYSRQCGFCGYTLHDNTVKEAHLVSELYRKYQPPCCFTHRRPLQRPVSAFWKGIRKIHISNMGYGLLYNLQRRLQMH